MWKEYLGTNISSLSIAKPTISQLLFAGGVEFGSRATGNYTKTSDHDIAILASNYYKMFPKDIYYAPEVSIDNYMDACPKHPCSILRFFNLDILLLTNKNDLEIVKKAVAETKEQLTYFRGQKTKTHRIKTYEANLIKYGWVTNKATTTILRELKASIFKKVYNVINNLRNKRYTRKT